MRRYCSEFKGQRQDQWRNGGILKYVSIHSFHHLAQQPPASLDVCDMGSFDLVLISS